LSLSLLQNVRLACRRHAAERVTSFEDKETKARGKTINNQTIQ
jgi:hypothetical protein